MAPVAWCLFRAATMSVVFLVAAGTHVGHVFPHGHLATEGFAENYVPQHRMSFMRRHRLHERHLRVCNAYPHIAPFDVFRGFKAKLTTDAPMAYKSCRDFKMPLKVGDKIRFLLGDHTAGVFVVQAMPPDSSVLLLVIKRHDTVSTAVAFQSHVFTKHASAQVAVINTYLGHIPSIIRMSEVFRDGTPLADPQSESRQLRYNSLETVDQGMYHLNMTQESGGEVRHTFHELVALNRESYVILVTGDNEEKSFQDLVVYPNSDPTKLPKRNSAQARSWVLGAIVALAHYVGACI